MLLLVLLVGMVTYIIIRLQMVSLEMSWLRKYMMRMLTHEARQAIPTSQTPPVDASSTSAVDEHDGANIFGVISEDTMVVESIMNSHSATESDMVIEEVHDHNENADNERNANCGLEVQSDDGVSLEGNEEEQES